MANDIALRPVELRLDARTSAARTASPPPSRPACASSTARTCATCASPSAAPRRRAPGARAAPGATRCSSSRRTSASSRRPSHPALGRVSDAGRMSLYQLQKFLYHLNRDPRGAAALPRATCARLLARYELDDEERDAILAGDIGLLYVLGANGQLLMHFAALLGMPWADYIAGDARRRAPPRPGACRRLRDDDAMDEKVARRMSLVFAGVCSHAPGITGRAAPGRPGAARSALRGLRATARRSCARAARTRSSSSPPSTSRTSS